VKPSHLLLVALCALVAGCGGSSSSGKDKSDKRGTALDCLKNEKHLPARLLGKDSIQIDGPDSPRIQFFLTSGEAEAFQFEGRAEGTEHIGAALLFVRKAPDDQLEKVEACLDDLTKD
jgi:hypothetical protein